MEVSISRKSQCQERESRGSRRQGRFITTKGNRRRKRSAGGRLSTSSIAMQGDHKLTGVGKGDEQSKKGLSNGAI